MPKPDEAKPEFYPAANDQVLTVRGRVVRMEWSKSGESWEAGGSEYYVLEREGEPKPDDPLGKRFIMRPTPAYPTLKHLAAYTGHSIEIRGREAGTITFQYPPEWQHSGLDRNGMASAGGGILVESIQVLPDPSVPAPK